MTTVPTIPPLLCSTPPPIDDFGADDEDSGLPPALSLDDDFEGFGDFATGINEEVPSPPLYELSSSTSGFTDMPPDLEQSPRLISRSCMSSSPEVTNLNQVKNCSTPKSLEAVNLNVSNHHHQHLDDIRDENVQHTQYKIIKPEVITTNYTTNDDVPPKDNHPSLALLRSESVSLNSGKQMDNSTPPSLSFASDDKLSDDEFGDFTADDTKIELQQSSETKDVSTRKLGNCLHTINIVTMEDLADDSSDDERHSPKQVVRQDTLDENSDDYFALHAVHLESMKMNDIERQDKEWQQDQNLVPSVTETVMNSIYDDVDDITTSEAKHEKDFENFSFYQTVPATSSCADTSKQIASDDVEHFNALTNTSKTNFETPTNVLSNQELLTTDYSKDERPAVAAVEPKANFPIDEVSFEANFDQFTELAESAPIPVSEPMPAVITQQQRAIIPAADTFVEFHDYNSSCKHAAQPSTADYSWSNASSFDNDVDDDDEFGDFTEATFAPPASVTVVPVVNTNLQGVSQLSTVNAKNVCERLKPVLESMFPSENQSQLDENTQFAKTTTIGEVPKKLELNSIDTAKALEQQWITSNVRHALIKALGIDSRNIFTCEKWNSSMPRFAINMSFDPLTPMKPQQTGDTAAATHSSSQQQKPSAAAASKSDIPDVEFDWNSAGLVNPLDGAKDDEIETIHAEQFGESNESNERQQQSYSGDTDTLGANDDNGNGVNVSDDSSTASQAVAGTATATTLSAVVPPDGIGNTFETGDERANFDGPETVAPVGDMSTSVELSEPDILNTLKEKDNFVISSNSSASLQQLCSEVDEVVTTCTYAGPLKETHIYTPSKGEGSAAPKTIRTMKVDPIDFDYEKAAAGIIIDETVVKKEYRDVEYNPGFDLEFGNVSSEPKIGSLSQTLTTDDFLPTAMVLPTERSQQVHQKDECDDEFTDFQSVKPPSPLPTVPRAVVVFPTNFMPNACNLPPLVSPATTTSLTKMKETLSRTSTPTLSDEMILCPAVLLPQAISITKGSSGSSNTSPKVEWGERAASIDPEELARIEELFPQPKSNKTKETVGTPTHNGPTQPQQQQQSSLSISASIAHKDKHGPPDNDDDDDWSDFVSVPAPNTHKAAVNTPKLSVNNNQRLTNMSPQRPQPRPPPPQTKVDATNNYSNDDEWSDFVSSAPPVSAQRAPPQFNSAAWQNANFYNNPLSFYHGNTVPNLAPTTSLKFQNNSNNNNNNNIYSNSLNQFAQYLSNNHHQQRPRSQLQQKPQTESQSRVTPQQVHIMQDFSTAAPFRPHVAPVPLANQFQMGNAKVAPSISLIPDLGFVAPAVPAHTAFINSLPRPNFNAKK